MIETHLNTAIFTRRGGRAWIVGGSVVAALVCLPIASLLVMALQGSPGLWQHLAQNVLPTALRDTIVLLSGVGMLTIFIGTATAWLVSAYEFRGRGILEWALLLPLAIPTYIAAYAYLDILHPVGAVQGWLRLMLGYDSPRDFRLPEVRSMGGCILLLGLVLYPYVYLTTRAMFMTQAANLIEVSRTLGSSRGGAFWRVALPLARPAIAVGVSLALMEALNDIGASEFLGVRTLTVSVYSTWINRTDLPGAAQIALAMLAVVAALVVLERRGRRQQRYATTVQRPRAMEPQRLTGWWGVLALAAGSLPILFGFAAPALYLMIEARKRFEFAGVSASMLAATANTVIVSALASAAVLVCGLVVAYAARLRATAWTAAMQRVAALGYAVPGTVLAIGVLFPIGLLDQFLANASERWLGISSGLLILGSGGAIVYAYTVRFMAISTGGIEAGFSRISPSLDHAARMLGQNATGTFRHVHLPLARAALAAAGLLVFVDCMKELPATLLLRPLNFETLSTLLYGEAARGTYEEASIAALIIVAIGILPVVLLARVGKPTGTGQVVAADQSRRLG